MVNPTLGAVRAGLRVGNGDNCPGPSAPRGTPVMALFGLNKILV